MLIPQALHPLIKEHPRKKGFSITEMVAVLFILSILIVLSLMSFHKYQKSMLLELTAKRIVESVSLARGYALNERKHFFVEFTQDTLTVSGEQKEIVGKEYRFPERIEVKDKSDGFNPVIMKPDGTAATGGFIKICDTSSEREIKIVMHNLTGRCFIEQ